MNDRILCRFQEKIKAVKDITDFYNSAVREVWNDSEKSYIVKFLSMPAWKYNDLLYRKYSSDIPFWRRVLGDETAVHAVKLLVLYSHYSLGSSLAALINSYALDADSDSVEGLYAKYYAPNASANDMHDMCNNIRAELGLNIHRR